MFFSKIMLAFWNMLCYNTTVAWGYSSAGRALDWQSRGQRFDPAYLHQKKDHPDGWSFFWLR